MKSIKVWDNNKSWDQYTVLIGTEYYGMSSNATSPSGFNQFIGYIGELDQRRLGKKIPHNLLPLDVRIAIKDRMKSHYQGKAIKRQRVYNSKQAQESKAFYIVVATILIVMYYLNTLK